MCAGKCIKICVCPTNCDFHVQHLPGNIIQYSQCSAGIKGSCHYQTLIVLVIWCLCCTFSSFMTSGVMCASPPGHLDIIMNYKESTVSQIDALNDITASPLLWRGGYGNVDTNCCGGRR